MIVLNWSKFLVASAISLFIEWGLSFLLTFGARHLASTPTHIVRGAGFYTLFWRYDLNPQSLLTAGTLLNMIDRGLSCVFAAGFAEITIRRIEGRPTSGLQVFLGFEKFFPLFLTGALISAIYQSASLVFCIPGFAVLGLFCLCPILIYRGQAGITNSMQMSFRLMKKYFWSIFLISFLCALIAYAGILVCLFGIFFTWPIFAVTSALVYLQFFPVRPPTVSASPSNYYRPGPSAP